MHIYAYTYIHLPEIIWITYGSNSNILRQADGESECCHTMGAI